jgi:hypothetical protein
MKQITVKAKISAGYHPGINTEIVKDQEYTIDESKWGEELFERPSPDWLAPWEREQSTETPVDEKKTGGKKL